MVPVLREGVFAMSPVVSCSLAFVLFWGTLLALGSTAPEFHKVIADPAKRREALNFSVVIFGGFAFGSMVLVSMVWRWSIPGV